MTPIAGAISGLIAYGVDRNLDGKLGKTSWEWFFIIEGTLTVAWGLIVLGLLPKLPETVAKRGSWLFRSEEEHAVLLRRTVQGMARMHQDGSDSVLTRRTAKNSPDAKPKAFQAVWALKDPQAWLGALVVAAPCLNVAAFGTFLPTFISEFGFSPRKSLLDAWKPDVTCSAVADIWNSPDSINVDDPLRLRHRNASHCSHCRRQIAKEVYTYLGLSRDVASWIYPGYGKHEKIGTSCWLLLHCSGKLSSLDCRY